MAAFSIKSKKSGKTYYLHSKDVELRAGHKQKIYYFAGVAGRNSLDKLPAGYETMENARTGLPMLRKIGGAAKKKKAPAKKKAAAKKAPAKKAAAKKAPAKKPAAKKVVAKKKAPAKKKSSAKRR